MAKNSILLESGTNEVEFIEFSIGASRFGVNVAKVKQIVLFDESLVSEIPLAPPSVYGMFNYRGQPIPLLDLGHILAKTRDHKQEKQLVMVTEFNGFINSFLIDAVNRIHRVSWSDVKPLNILLESYGLCYTGSVNLDGDEVLLLDLEQIIAALVPAAAAKNDADNELTEKICKDFGRIRTIIAEDSIFTRKVLVNNLKGSGFDILAEFDNGKDAYDFIAKGKEAATDFFDVLITDIEMPCMDGLTLCKKVKELYGNAPVSVVVFSSLISSELIEKCKKVKADGYLGKPDIKKLKEIIMDVLHKKTHAAAPASF